MIRTLCTVLAMLFLTLAAVSAAEGRAEAPEPDSASEVVAKVGDQVITFDELNTMLNSSAVVGVSIPALGTPERDTARITVLDKVISANLLYLDALRQGLDKDPAYQKELEGFVTGMLAGLYRQRHLAGDIPVSEEEIQDFYEHAVSPDTPLSEELRAQIEATLRKSKLQERLAGQRERLREAVSVNVHSEGLAPGGDGRRDDATPVADVDGEVISWGEVKAVLRAAGRGAVASDPLADETDARLGALEAEIDKRIMARKARELGLDRDPLYQARLAEFRKTRLINLHRARLAAGMEPSEAQLEAYYEANRNRIARPETRKIQEVVLETEAEARALKSRLEAAELTMYEAAADYSIAPGAKQHLGEVGWVARGRAQPELDELIFALGPDQVGGPARSSEGWHLVRVLDMREAERADFDDEATRAYARRKYIHDKLDAYVVDLRREQFEVHVYEEVLVRLAQREADMVEELARKAQQPDSITQQRVEELGKMLRP